MTKTKTPASKPRKPNFQATDLHMEAIVQLLWPAGFDNGIPNCDQVNLTVLEMADSLELSATDIRTVITGMRKAGFPIELPGGSRYAAFARTLGVVAPTGAVPASSESVAPSLGPVGEAQVG